MGSNTTEAHPIIANRIKKAVKSGLKMIVIDPRKIDMVKECTPPPANSSRFGYRANECHDPCDHQ